MGDNCTLITTCKIDNFDNVHFSIPFFHTVFGSHEIRMSDSSKSANKAILAKNNNKLINVRLKKCFPYIRNAENTKDDPLYYEVIFCKHPSCLKSQGPNKKKISQTKFSTNRTAKGKIVVLNGDLQNALIYAKGSSFYLAIDPKRITPDQKTEVIHSYTNYKTTPKLIAKSVG